MGLVRTGQGQTVAALVGALLMLAATVSGSAAADRLKGNVVKDGSPRLARPQSATLDSARLKGAASGALLPGSAAAARVPAGLDSAAFDLKVQRARLPAAIQFPSWSDSTPQYDSAAEIRAEMDRFFSGANDTSAPLTALAEHRQTQHRMMIHVQMGLCGPWDADGEGRRRWRMLADELHGGGELCEKWRAWQREVMSIVQANTEALAGMHADSALHVVVHHNGSIAEVSPYSGHGGNAGRAESWDGGFTQTITQVVRNIGQLPPFPAGSKAPEGHVLIYAASR